MQILQTILPILLVAISTFAMLAMAYIFFKRNNEKDITNLQFQLKKERQKHFLPMRVDAYQRAVLLMERISPGNLVMLQADLLKAIREEYDHNASQQLFVSPQGWEMVRNSKEETIKIINIAGNQMQATSTGTDLAAKIFELVAEIGKLPTEITIDYLKRELQEMF
jgi:hypothetical protein